MLFEDITPETIKESILNAAVEIDTREGSYFNNLVSPAAYEMYRVYQAMEAFLPILFPDETSGEWIDRRCADYGIERKKGVRAKAVLKFTGKTGAVVPENTPALTETGLLFRTDEELILTETSGTVMATAEAEGEKYNLPEGSITVLQNTITGIEGVTSGEATGGINPESDASLCARLYSYLQQPSTSGNKYDYERWAREVNGVEAAKAVPLWNGAGTVKVLLAGPGMVPAGSDVVEACKTHIEEVRPIGASVTVVSATSLPVNISAKVQLGVNTTVETVIEEFKRRLSEYLAEIAFKRDVVVYYQLAMLLLSIDGVFDMADFLVNGGTENLSVKSDEIPTLGTVEVTERAY